MMGLSLATVLAGVGASLRGLGGRGAVHNSRRTSRTAPLVGAGSVRRFVNRFMVGGSSATVIESALIMVLVGLACMPALRRSWSARATRACSAALRLAHRSRWASWTPGTPAHRSVLHAGVLGRSHNRAHVHD